MIGFLKDIAHGKHSLTLIMILAEILLAMLYSNSASGMAAYYYAADFRL